MTAPAMSIVPRGSRIPGLTTVLAVAFLLAAPVGFVFFRFVKHRLYSEAAEDVHATMESLRNRRPTDVPNDQWNHAVDWTSNVIDQVYASPEHGDLDSFQRLSRLLKRKTTGTVDLGTLRWVWDECERAKGHGQVYAVRYRDVRLLTKEPITDESLLDLWSRNKVSWLDLNRTEITDAGLDYLSNLTQLRFLWLDGTNVSDAGLKNINALTQLKSLTLGDTSISDDGLKHLSGMTQLEKLHLNDTSVTSAGLHHLNGLTSLIHLDLSNTAVDDAGLEYIRGLKRLTFLALKDTAVTQSGIDDLQLALPECEFRK